MRRFATVLALAAALLMGCDNGPPPPAVYPTTGVVLGTDGSPARGGMVEFRQTEAPYFVATSPVAPDGTFRLAAIVEERRLDGVPEGSYRVTVLPDFSGSAQDQHLTQPVVLQEPISVSAAANNILEIDVRNAAK